MPITPFHFGPGLLLHSAAPRGISFTAFLAANVLIDLESAYFLLTGGWPVHRVLHTVTFGPVAGVFAGWMVHVVWLSLGRRAPAGAPGLRAALLGGLLGGVTHALLDGAMHADMRPMWPFAGANPLLGWIGIGALHLLCLVAGGIGLLVLLVRYWRESPTQERLP